MTLNRKPAVVLKPGHVKYRDSEFSDTEVEAFMLYFKVQTYDRLKSVLRAMTNIKE